MGRDIRTFEYVNHPYDAVRALLSADAAGAIGAATGVARSHASSVAGALKVEIGGLQVSSPVDIEVGAPVEDDLGPSHSRQLRLPIRWKAAEHPGLFPVMQAELWVYPLTGTETQLDFRGEYDPPLGVVGAAIDAAVGHRIAEASVNRLIAELARYLRARLTDVR